MKGLVTEHEPDETSPAGKGRPTYGLATPVADVRTLVANDERFTWVPPTSRA